MITVYLFRHGAIQLEGPRRFVGQADLPLSDEGLRQAAWWRDRLEDVPFGAVHCSDLSRCRDTARIVKGNRNIAVEEWRELREIGLGDWEGVPMEEVRRRHPDLWLKRGSDLARTRPPRGESFEDLRRRVTPAFHEIVSREQGPVALVAHAGVNRVLLCHVLGIPLEHLFRIGQDYGALNIMEGQRKAFRVLLLNCRPGPRPWKDGLDKG